MYFARRHAELRIRVWNVTGGCFDHPLPPLTLSRVRMAPLHRVIALQWPLRSWPLWARHVTGPLETLLFFSTRGLEEASPPGLRIVPAPPLHSSRFFARRRLLRPERVRVFHLYQATKPCIGIQERANSIFNKSAFQREYNEPSMQTQTGSYFSESFHALLSPPPRAIKEHRFSADSFLMRSFRWSIQGMGLINGQFAGNEESNYTTVIGKQFLWG